MPPTVTPTGTGRIIVRLSNAVAAQILDHPDASSFGDLRLVAAALGLVDLMDVLDSPQYLHAPTHRLVERLSITQLDDLERRAFGGPRPETGSLTAFWVIDAHPVRDSMGLLHALNDPAAESVSVAYFEPVLAEPATVPNPDRPQQGYREQAPLGVDADYANAQGFSGAGVRFVDVEWSWNLYHEDLAPTTIRTNQYGEDITALFYNENGLAFAGDCPEHGTNVLGIVIGVDNQVGILGIASGVASVGVSSRVKSIDPWDDTDLVGAIIAAVLPDNRQLAWGDVLLLEVQTEEWYPIESVVHFHLLIRLASALGFIVIQPAGNGGYDLDSLGTGTAAASGENSSITPLDPASEYFVDSGAIVVGAAHEDVETQGGESVHLPYIDPYGSWASCYGSRIDCYAWGAGVYTTGGRDPTWAECNRQYNPAFNGTSAASAILAGVALVAQQMAEESLGYRLSPAQMRSLLSNPANGTGYGLVNGEDRPIGVMPDLKQIATSALGAVPDVYIRDSELDMGEQPAAAVFQSPDIVVRNQRTSQEVDWPAELIPGDSVVPDSENFVYARLRNRGPTATEATVTVYWSEVTSLLTPDLWNEIGQTEPVQVLGGHEPVIPEPISWIASAEDRPANGHGCLVAVADSPHDPRPPEITDTDLQEFGDTFWDRFLGYVGSNNNVAWRNFNVVNSNVQAGTAVAGWFLTGSPDRARTFDLIIERPFHPSIALWWDLPRSAARMILSVPSGCPFSGRQRLRPTSGEPFDLGLRIGPGASTSIRGVRFGRGSRYPCRFRLNWSGHRESGVYPVALRQMHEGVEVGRVAWEFRVD